MTTGIEKLYLVSGQSSMRFATVSPPDDCCGTPAFTYNASGNPERCYVRNSHSALWHSQVSGTSQLPHVPLTHCDKGIRIGGE